MDKIKKIFKIREVNLIIINMVMIIILSIIFPNFYSSFNIIGILNSIAINSIMIGPMTILFISGGIDLSVGAVLGFCVIIVTRLIIISGIPYQLGILFIILIGMTIGLIIGYLIAYLNINPFITTLSFYFIFRGFKFIFSGGSLFGLPESFRLISQYQILHIPTIIIFAIFSIIIWDILARKNIFFRQVYYIGGNEQGATLGGIRVKRIKLISYLLVSISAAIASIFYTSKFMGAYSTAGNDNTFQLITAVIIGGASLKGGKGTILGSFLGLIIVALIYDALIFLKVDVNFNEIVIGFLLILVIILDNITTKERLQI